MRRQSTRSQNNGRATPESAVNLTEAGGGDLAKGLRRSRAGERKGQRIGINETVKEWKAKRPSSIHGPVVETIGALGTRERSNTRSAVGAIVDSVGPWAKRNWRLEERLGVLCLSPSLLSRALSLGSSLFRSLSSRSLGVLAAATFRPFRQPLQPVGGRVEGERTACGRQGRK
jgi:hypothetical protein